MWDHVTVAAISFVPRKFDVADNLARLIALVRQAAVASPAPDLILAPEGILEGYPVMDIRSGDVDSELMRAVAFTDVSQPIIELQQLAAELAVCLAFGYAEAVGSSVHNCAIFIDHTGQICGKYHKLQLAEGHLADGSCWYNELGAHGRAFDTPLGRVGFLICNDRWNADLVRLPVLDGAKLLLIPSYGEAGPTNDATVLARARCSNHIHNANNQTILASRISQRSNVAETAQGKWRCDRRGKCRPADGRKPRRGGWP